MKNKERVVTINIPEGIESLPKPFQDFVHQILGKLLKLEEELRALRAEHAELKIECVKLKAENVELKAENAELRLRLSKNSSNSNNPPSSDRFERKSKPQSEREKSGKKTGGQPGHKGVTLNPTDKPDEIKYHDAVHCKSCKYDLSDVKPVDYVARQECDIPPVRPIIIEHRMTSKICPECKQINAAEGPKELTQPIQYGPTISTLSTYFHFDQLIPLKRMQRMFQDLFSLSLSEGTLVNMHEKLYTQLEATEEQIRNVLLNSPVNNFDETSMYVNGKTQWLHVVSNEFATAYFVHSKRGTVAMNAMNILPHYKGVAVHDFWKPYFTYEELVHSLCNEHHSRELRAMFENYEQTWAQKMRQLLFHIKQVVDEYKDNDKSELPVELLRSFSVTYDFILQGAQFQIPHCYTPQSKKRGRAKQHPAKNLLDRLTQRKRETLRFMYDFRVPFTNNQAERDIRMAKVKQKISGCFRSEDGASRFSRIRGYISTSKKRDVNVFQALENAARGQPEAFLS